MGVGRRADQHGIYIACPLNLVNAADLCAGRIRNSFRSVLICIGNRHQPGASVRSDCARMNLADTACAETVPVVLPLPYPPEAVILD